MEILKKKWKSGHYFQVGTTTVTAVATGPSGNEDVCTFDVIVNDKGRNKSAEISGTALQLNHFTAYPNPFSERVCFEFVPAEDVRAQIKIFDVTGRLMKTVFDQPVKTGVLYNAEFKSGETVSSFYFYRMNLGEFMHTGKLIYQK